MKLFKKNIFFVLITFFACNAQQEVTNYSIALIYKAQTRGAQITITYKEDKIVFISGSDHKTIKLTKKQKQQIQIEVSKIVLSEINNLTAPSDKRFTDGALFASFQIKKNIDSYTSSDFDHKNPPEELKPLYILLESIIKKG